MKIALYVLQYAKRHFSGQSDVEQWKNQVCSFNHYAGLKALVSQSVSQSVENSVK